MNLVRVEEIAEAVLYEGYMLYPYRASAVKNQQRWNFGVVCPRAYSEEQNGSEAWTMRTECLLQADSSTQLDITVRFLQIVNRSIGKLKSPVAELSPGTGPAFEIVDKLMTGGRTYLSWQEAAEREVNAPRLRPAIFSAENPLSFSFPAGRELEPVHDDAGMIVGVIIREWKEISGSVAVDVKDCRKGVFKVAVVISNLTPREGQQHDRRDEALRYSLISTHTILAAEGGEFVSMLDPPEELRQLAGECSNVGTWPVLVGDEGERRVILSSPIILYDYPQIAPESPGSLFDGTEIDEILSLRILTMTEEEKQEMRESDERARRILERTESMPAEQFMKLHGVLRGLQPAAPATTREAQ